MLILILVESNPSKEFTKFENLNLNFQRFSRYITTFSNFQILKTVFWAQNSTTSRPGTLGILETGANTTGAHLPCQHLTQPAFHLPVCLGFLIVDLSTRMLNYRLGAHHLAFSECNGSRTKLLTRLIREAKTNSSRYGTRYNTDTITAPQNERYTYWSFAQNATPHIARVKVGSEHRTLYV